MEILQELKNYSSKVDKILISDGTKFFLKKHKVSRSEPSWWYFTEQMLSPELKGQCTRKLFPANTVSITVNQWSKIISVTLVGYFTERFVEFGKKKSSNFF